MRFELSISLRYFRSRRQEGAVSFISGVAVLGVTLGVAALVVAMSVMNGYEANLVRAMAGALPHISLHPLVPGGVPERERVLRLLEGEAEPTSVSRLVLQEALVRGPPSRGGASIQGVLLRGVDPAGERQVPEFLAFLDDGSPGWAALPAAERQRRARVLLARLSEPVAPGVYPVLLSEMLADKLGVEVGGELTPLAFPEEGRGFSPQPVGVRLKLIGHFSTGIVTFDELVAITDVDMVPEIFPRTAPTPSLGLRLSEPLAAQAVARSLRLRMEREGRDFYVYSWLESNKGLFQVIRVQKVMLFLVLMLIVVIAFFGMISALVMLVGEKTREITILKSLGARDRSIYRVFLFQGVLIGVAGTVLGVGFGLGTCAVLDAFPVFEIPPGVYPGSDRVPVLVSPLDVTLVAAATMVACLVATVFPARKATALKPVEGLRYG